MVDEKGEILNENLCSFRQQQKSFRIHKNTKSDYVITKENVVL